jgi:amidase
MADRVHAFTDDALGDLDAVALAERVRAGKTTERELVAASAARAAEVEARLHAIARPMFDAPRRAVDGSALLRGVPTALKDNTDLRGLPSTHGSEAFTARPAKRDGAYSRQYLATGLTVVAKSRLPEFGFNASTEFRTGLPVANPWQPEFSVGASSGGSAALVAAGVVPIAHANDGGGSIRIPAAAAGLVGFKPSRGRHIDGEQARQLPINMVSEGVLTRTVRDTATFLAAAEEYWRNPALPPVGLVRGPANRRLRVGIVFDTVTGSPLDAETRTAVERTAALLESAGHVVEPAQLPVSTQFADDFLQYWALLAELAVVTGRFTYDKSFDRSRIDGLTRGLQGFHRRHLTRTVPAIRRLKRTPQRYAQLFARHEVVLTPVLAHVTPRLGWLSPNVPYEQLIQRLIDYVAYTPVNNIAGTPAIAVPAGLSTDGTPIGVMLSGAHGDDRTLLEVAFALEAQQPFPRIQDNGDGN